MSFHKDDPLRPLVLPDGISPAIISGCREYSKEFSVCCMVTRWSDYEGLLQSMKVCGFDDTNSEFLVADNSGSNALDGFASVRGFLSAAVGKYVLIVHQDLRFLTDTRETLLRRIDEVEKLDPAWAVLGNAGKQSENYLHAKMCLMANNRVFRDEGLPCKVVSLDENFLLVKRSTGVTVSGDLHGFDFYGLEVCQVAIRLGYSCYVIDFLCQHDSAGTLGQSFFLNRRNIETKYRALSATHGVATTCTVVSWSGSRSRALSHLIESYRITEFSEVHEKGREIILDEIQKMSPLRASQLRLTASLRKRRFWGWWRRIKYSPRFLGLKWIGKRTISDVRWWRINYRQGIRQNIKKILGKNE